MKKLITILLALSALASAKAEQSRYGIIPAPKTIVPAEGAFTLKNTTALVVEARDTLFWEVAGDFAAQAALLRSYIGADEKKKQIITELMRRLAIDVKDELMKAAGGGLRAATQALSEWKNSK